MENLEIKFEDFVSGEKFIEIADHQYNKLNDYNNTYGIPEYIDPIVIYCHTEFVNQLFTEIKNKNPFILISHNGDGKVTYEPKNKNDADIKLIPDNLIHWFGQNVQPHHHKITSIPIGLENSCWFSKDKKQETIYTLSKKEREHTNLCYMNFNINTNRRERQHVYNMFKNCDYVTVDMRKNGADFNHYINMTRTHKFVLCPEGNPNKHSVRDGGTNTHRMWECLYVKSIPIIMDGPQTSHFKDLPMLLVNSWNEINKDFLTQKYEEIISKDYSCEKMKLSYWKNIINKYRSK